MTFEEKKLLKTWGSLFNVKKKFYESYKKYRIRILGVIERYIKDEK
jgi:hypothetical protein